jgi:outer membrane immunogenic protein
MKMKSAFVGLVSGVALAMSAASAGADGTYRGSVVAAPYSWSGLYVGVNAGYAWSDTDWVFPPPGNFFGPAGTTFSSDSSGGLVGGHIGVQHQWGNIVAGAEVSYSATWLNDTVVGPVPVFPNDRFKTEINDLLLVVGRLGYAAHNFLIYGKGGFASSDVELSGRSGAPVAGVTFSESQRLTGWTAGAGVEWMLSRNLILGVEYNYVHLDNEAFDARTGGTVVGLPVLVGVDDVIIQTVMARLSYKFGGDRAAPLK